MRKLLIMLLIVPFFSVAQKEPSKKDDLIIIKGSTLDLGGVTDLLYKSDFEVDIKESDLIITRYKPIDGLNNLKMKISFTDSALTIKSFYKLSTKVLGSDMRNTVATWHGERGGTPKTVLRAAIKFAEKLGGEISFANDKMK